MFIFPDQDFMGSSESVSFNCFRTKKYIEAADFSRKRKSGSCLAEVTTKLKWLEPETLAGKKKTYLVHFTMQPNKVFAYIL